MERRLFANSPPYVFVAAFQATVGTSSIGENAIPPTGAIRPSESSSCSPRPVRVAACRSGVELLKVSVPSLLYTASRLYTAHEEVVGESGRARVSRVSRTRETCLGW